MQNYGDHRRRRHHIRERENRMLPKAKELEIDFEALGQI